MHFANELSSIGHKVYFVNPPWAQDQKELASIKENDINKNITVIDLKAIKGSQFFRYKLHFIYEIISKRYIKAIKELIPGKIDELWCFNPHVYFNLKDFKADRTLLLLYDFYQGKHIFKVANTADAIVSVSSLILDHYKNINIPKLLLQHGLGKHFTDIAKKKSAGQDLKIQQGDKIKIGYVGNLMREAINTDIAQKLIEQHQEKEFHFWGPNSAENNNLDDYAQVSSFINFLNRQKNVFMHGVKDQETLAAEINNMDAFLFLYSAKNDLNKASNSHKILEYLSTGKVIVSTYVSNYAETDLLVMSDPGKDEDLPALFDKVVNNLGNYNSETEQRKRIAFALDNTYIRQIDRIQGFISTGSLINEEDLHHL